MIFGLGFGTSLSSLIVLARVNVGPEDSAILMATLTQIRVLGGCMGLAVSSALITTYTRSRLKDVLTFVEIEAVRDSTASISHLPAVIKRSGKKGIWQCIQFECLYNVGYRRCCGLCVRRYLKQQHKVSGGLSRKINLHRKERKIFDRVTNRI